MKNTELKKVILSSCLIVLAVCAVLWLAVSRSARPEAPKEPERVKGGLPVIAPMELKVTPSKEGVAEFLEKNEDYTTIIYEGDTCYNITPGFVADNSDFAIFKYDISAEAFLLYDGEVYHIGTGWGGSGVESMALADLNQDGQYELYYTFSFGSGIGRTKIAYFDPSTKKEESFDYASYYYGIILTANGEGELCVNIGTHDLDYSKDWYVDYSMKATEQQMGTIRLEDGTITLKIDPEYEEYETLW